MRIPYALSLILVASCKTSSPELSSAKSETPPAEELGLSMNDVSILFPNHQNPAFLAGMPKLSEGYVPAWAGQELANNFQNRPTGDKTVDGPGRFQADLSPYSLAAMRIDPCPNDIQTKGDDKLCIRQIRATWQIQNRQLGPFAMDSNVHTAYHLSDEEFRTVLSRLRELHANASIDTSGMPLGVHPVIQKEGPQSPYLQGVLALLKTFARPEKLMVMAGMRRSDFETWSMTTFSQDLKTQTIRQSPLIGVTEDPALPPSKTQLFSANRQKSSSFLMVRPPSSNPENIAEENRAAVSRAVAFENPRLHNPLTADCSSCHQAAHLSQHPELSKPPLDPQVALKGFTSALDLSITIAEPTDKTALQMFSFSGAKPRVTPRVVNETAHVLEYLKNQGF